MTEVLKLYLLGFLISVPGVSDQNETKIAQAEPEPTAVVARVPVLNNYKSCLLPAKKQFTTCTTGLNKSIKSNTGPTHTIFKKQRKCEIKREENISTCKRIFLK